MKISEDQNVVEFDGIKAVAVIDTNGISGCYGCAFGPVQSVQSHAPCNEIPCLPYERIDKNNVHFEIMEEQQ